MRYLLVGVLLVTSWCRAQNVSGDVRGRVQTTDGSPVENVNIRIDGVTVPMSRVATTQLNGGFVFLGLPVGDFTMTITHVSFRELVISPVRVTLGGTTNLGSIMLEQGQTTLDSLVVSGGSVQYKSEFSTGLSKRVMDNLPTDRDYKSAITLLPQVNASYFGDGLSINGSTGAENMFYVNGVNVTDNYSSQYAPSLNNSSFVPYNFIKEVSVKESGYSAEFGRAIGGIVDLVTQSGTNEFKGQAFSYYSGSIFNGDPKGGTTGAIIGKTSNYDVGISLGGPIIKDKLWFFTAYSYYENQRETKIADSFYPDKTTTHLFALKLDWKVSPKTTAELVVIADPTKSTPVVAIDALTGSVPDVVENADALWARTENGGISLALTGKTKLSERTLIEYGISGYQKRVDFGGATVYGDTTSQYYDTFTATVSGGIGYLENFDIGKQNGRVKITHHDGNHTIKAGVELELNTQKGTSEFPSSGDILKLGPTPDVATTHYEVYGLYSPYDNALHYQAAYLQHDWQVTPRMFVEMGIRWERQQMGNGAGTVYQTFDNQWQPRLGINWFLDKKETMKLSVNYGRVYQTIPLHLNGVFGGRSDINSFTIDSYLTDPRQPGAVLDTNLLTVSGSNQLQPSDKNIYRSSFSDQFNIQYQYQVNKNLLVSVRALWKMQRDAFITSADSSYNRYIGNPGMGDLSYLPKISHDYTAFELGISGKTQNGRLNYGLYYVWSRNYGNYAGAWDQELRYLSVSSATLGYQTKPERASRTNGLLPSDRTNSIKANAYYQFDFGLTAGANVAVITGTPLSEYSLGYYSPYGYDFLLQRGTAGRLPFTWDLNFRFSYKKDHFPVRISMDVFHVGNPQEVVDQVQLKFNDGFATIPNAGFGKALRRQPPMAVRFGIEYNF